MSRCPRCDSPAPHLHPAVQHEGEAQPCSDDYHRRVTSQNTPKRIAETDRLLEVLTPQRASHFEAAFGCPPPESSRAK